MPSLSYSAERLDSHHQSPREPCGFLFGTAAGQQPFPQCGFGYPPNLPVEPSHVRNRNGATDFRSLPLVAEIDEAVLDGGDKAGRPRLETFGVPPVSRYHGRSPPPHCASPIGDQVSRLSRESRDLVFENGGIRSA